jgi:hypothetical protein
MSLAIFAMIQELKARVSALEEEVKALQQQPLVIPADAQVFVPEQPTKPGTIRLTKDRL